MIKKLIVSVMIASFMCIISGCSEAPKNIQSKNSKLTVVVSFNAIKELAESVGGNKINIETIIPNGTEPHDYEPKVKDLQTLSSADIFIYNGLNMESWESQTISAVGNRKLTEVDASKGFKPIEVSGGSSSSEYNNYDPHAWLSIKGAEYESKSIENALIKKDPKNKYYYKKNYEKFYSELESLYDEYNKKFKNVKRKDFVTGHAAFAYLCRDFGLSQKSVEDVFAEGEPSSRSLKELTDYCRKNNVKTVFVEDMVSPKVSKALASEVGAKVEKIYTLESKEDNKDYIESMRYNLNVIYKSLNQ